MKILINCGAAILILLTGTAFAGEKHLMEMAERYYAGHEYYFAITETKRYEFLYPDGDRMPDILLLQGKAYLMGDNYPMALSSFEKSAQNFPATRGGEEALYMAGYARIVYGSAMFGAREIDRYLNAYPSGRFTEEAYRDLCYASALSSDLSSARNEIDRYKRLFPEGKFGEELDAVDSLIMNEIYRPKKSAAISFAGSLLLPGFGHFYTGRIPEGLLALATNSLFLYLTLDAISSGDRLKAFLFGFIGFNFYQYSLSASVANVKEYNSSEKFTREIKLRISGRF